MLMARDHTPRHFDASLIGERVGLALDPWQAKLLSERPKRALLLCSRQAGKSTVTALMALHAAIYDPGLILMLSPSHSGRAKNCFASCCCFTPSSRTRRSLWPRAR